MKPVATLLIIVFCLSTNPSGAQTTEVNLRPAYVDLSSADANYRDRLGPAYDANFQTVELPAAIPIVNAYHITHDDVDLVLEFAGLRLVVLAWDAEEPTTRNAHNPQP